MDVYSVIGGSGFIGNYVVRELAARGHTVQVISRHPERASHLRTAGAVGQVVLNAVNAGDDKALHYALEGSQAVMYLPGILYPRAAQLFDNVHAEWPRRIAHISKNLGVQKFLFMSALGINRAARRSAYAASKLRGEEWVRESFPQAVIMRPSVVFGHEDHFFNAFAQMSRYCPLFPLVNGGNTRFQPVYVGDVAKACVVAMEEERHAGKTFGLGGPGVYTLKQLVELVLEWTHHRCVLMSLPRPAALALASVMECLPHPMLTRDQVRLLDYDNVLKPSDDIRDFTDLGIVPKPIEAIVPGYLARYKGWEKAVPVKKIMAAKGTAA
jgi:uncharacterized protein YbjT (DUF2867 family)